MAMVRYQFKDFRKEFPDEESAQKFVLRRRYKGVPLYKRRRGTGYSDSLGRYINPLRGTIFLGHRLPLRTWFYAIFLLQWSPFWSMKRFEKELKVSERQSYMIVAKLRPYIKHSKHWFRVICELIDENPCE